MNLKALRLLWLRPGNYQLCGSVPPNAQFSLCKETDEHCELLRLICHTLALSGGVACHQQSQLGPPHAVRRAYTAVAAMLPCPYPPTLCFLVGGRGGHALVR